METEIKILNDSTAIGKRYSYGWANQQHIYFAIRFNKPFNSYILNGNKTNEKQVAQINSTRQGPINAVNAQFIFQPTEQVDLKVALSTTSAEKAIEALNEIPNWNFNQVKSDAENQWEKELGKIKVESTDETLKKIFYSALYHTAVSPTLYSDKDGEYKN